MKAITWLASLLGTGMLAIVACNKDNGSASSGNIPAGQSNISVYLSDAPVTYVKVLVDIRQVAVRIDTAQTQNSPDTDDEWLDNWRHGIWDTLSITPGIYDLLELRNGTDTLLASGNYPAGKVLKVRITLGSDNKVYTDSTTSYPLEIFGPNPYFDINVRRENVYSVSNNQFKLWLDFNLNRSIFFWNGSFLLSPYVVAYNDVTTSKIQGLVLPQGASPFVEAFNATDTVYAVPGWQGNYLVRGINPGTYSITFYGHGGYNDTTISNIVVNSGSTSKAPTVTLHK